MEFIFQLSKLLKRIGHQDLNYKEIASFLVKFVHVFRVILWMNKGYFPVLDKLIIEGCVTVHLYHDN
jgi:hypothetical protein